MSESRDGTANGTIDNLPAAVTDGVSRRDVIRALNASLLATVVSPLLATAQTQAFASDRASALRKVRLVEDASIPMRDGVRLAARIWMPEDSEREPVPAILGYDPYFARLFSRAGDGADRYLAGHGYACIKVDIRGSGDSQGRSLDEYVQQEQDDALEIIEWIARQPWCSGSVGMEGLSWGGFSSLQVAARRPPALKAIITLCSSDDRYSDDAHYKGGCIVSDMFNWGTLFLAFQGQAAFPAATGKEEWRERWLERLNAVEFNLGKWMTHPHRDAFWKHGSVSENYENIACPVYAIGGWVDGYKNAVFRLLDGLKVPRKGLIGPWTHTSPDQGVPGPAIGYLDEALRWWDHWLKGSETGIMQEPMLRVWMQSAVPTPRELDVPGRWVVESSWPAPRIAEQTLFLNAPATLDREPAKEQRLSLAPLQTVGIVGGNWCPSGGGGEGDLAIEMALDQRVDDIRSLMFDSDPLSEPLEILGSASLLLELSVDKPVAFIAARLNDVTPGGESGRVSFGVLNLCHRDSHETPTALEPNKRYTVRVPLDYAAHHFQPGHRLRVSISTSYWPMVQPSPEAVTLSLFSGACRLVLPVRPSAREVSQPRPFAPPHVAELAISTVSAEPGARRIEWDVESGTQVIHHRVATGITSLDDIDTRLVWDSKMRYEIRDRDPASSTEAEFTVGWEHGEMAPRVVAFSRTTMTPSEFIVLGRLDAFDGDEKVYTRTWNQRIPRKLV